MSDQGPDFEEFNGFWGKAGDTIMCLLPILFLVVMTVKPSPASTAFTLPVSAAMLWIIRTVYLESDPNLCNAAVIAGVLDAATPLTIIWGVLVMFQSMEITGLFERMVRFLKIASIGHPVAETMLIGCCFVYLIEGAAGFGTPIALSAPILIQLGHDPVDAICAGLIFDAFGTVFGAFGIPIWFGLADVIPEDEDQLEVGFRAGLCQNIVAICCIWFGCSQLCSREDMMNSWKFILLSASSCCMPSLLIAYGISYEFATILGGVFGLVITTVLIQHRIGLVPSTGPKQRGVESMEGYEPFADTVEQTDISKSVSFAESSPESSEQKKGNLHAIENTRLDLKEFLVATFPISFSILVLILTRVRDVGLYEQLRANQAEKPEASLQLEKCGEGAIDPRSWRNRNSSRRDAVAP